MKKLSPYKKVMIFGLTISIAVMVVIACTGYFNVEAKEASERFLSTLICVTGVAGIMGIGIFDDKI